MKQPRTSDFDPNAKSKTLKSSMDNLPAIEAPPKNTQTDDSSTTRTIVPPVRVVQPTLTGKRKIKTRHPFDIYEDQVEELRRLSIEDRMRGGAGSMSAMVREALDRYISNKRTG